MHSVCIKQSIHTKLHRYSADGDTSTTITPGAYFFFGARIWLGTILGRFSINYFSGLGLRIRVRVLVRVSVGVGVRVSVVIWSG